LRGTVYPGVALRSRKRRGNLVFIIVMLNYDSERVRNWTLLAESNDTTILRLFAYQTKLFSISSFLLIPSFEKGGLGRICSYLSLRGTVLSVRKNRSESADCKYAHLFMRKCYIAQIRLFCDRGNLVFFLFCYSRHRSGLPRRRPDEPGIQSFNRRSEFPAQAWDGPAATTRKEVTCILLTNFLSKTNRKVFY